MYETCRRQKEINNIYVIIANKWHHTSRSVFIYQTTPNPLFLSLDLPCKALPSKSSNSEAAFGHCCEGTMKPTQKRPGELTATTVL